MSALAEFHVTDGPEVELLADDLDERTYRRASDAGFVAWDIETSGLDWRTDRIATVQVLAGDHVAIVQLGTRVPTRLKRLLEAPAVTKLFHHAMFDLRFMARAWDAVPSNVACTKIAAKLAHRDLDPSAYSLAALVRQHLGVVLDKHQQLSDWTASTLDAQQIQYAADDVRYLEPLYDRLDAELRREGRADLRDRCLAHVPTRVELELGGFDDVYTY